VLVLFALALLLAAAVAVVLADLVVRAALAAGVPLDRTWLSSLMPKWTAFASPLFVSLPADPEQIDTWLRAVAADASVQ